MDYDIYFDTLFGVTGAFLSFFLGGLDSVMTVLLVFVACDIVTGLMKAIVNKRLCSDIGFKGISKKVCMFVFIGIAHVIDREMLGDTPVLRDGVMMFYLASEGISIMENAIDMNAPVPEVLKEYFLSWRNKQLVSKNKPADEED